MRAYYAALICVLAILLLAGAVGVQAQEEPTWQPEPLEALDPAPWLTAGNAWVAATSDEEPQFLTARVADDAFVASQYPFDWHAFGNETSVWFGRDATLGQMWALLRFDQPTLPVGVRYLGATIYLPIVGQDPEADLPMTAHAILQGWMGSTVKWQEQPYTETDPLTSFTIGKELGWYWFDISDVFWRWHSRQVNFWGVSLRGPESSGNVVKGMFSREAGQDKPVPTLVVAYLPDHTPPTCNMHALPSISPATVLVSWQCSDDISGIEQVELAMRAQGQEWQLEGVFWRGQSEWPVKLENEGGRRYEFRVRAEDVVGNVSAWTPEGAAVTTIETTPPVTIARTAEWLRSEEWQSFPNEFFETSDPGPVASGVARSERQFANDADDIWRNSDTYSGLPLTKGAYYRFRMRSIDLAGNVGEWAVTSPVGVYQRQVSGSVTDSTGQTLANLALQTMPAAMNVVKTNDAGQYLAYLANATPYTLTSSLPAFELTFALIPASADDVGGLAHRLLGAPNAVNNGAFDAPFETGWTLGGGAASRTERLIGDGNLRLRMGAQEDEALTDRLLGSPGCLLTTADGLLHVGWVQANPNRVFYARRSAEAGWTRVMVSPRKEADPSARWLPGAACLLQADPEGNLHMVYPEANGPWNYALKDPEYVDWARELRPYKSPIMHIKGLAASANETGHILYEAADNSLQYAMLIWRSGWQQPAIVATPFGSSGSMYEAALLYTPEGIRHAVWVERVHQSVWHSSSTTGIGWSEPRRLSTTPTDLASHLSLVRAANGDLYAFWMELSGSFNELVYARLPRGGAWSAARPSPVRLAFNQNSFYSVLVDSAGWWYLHVAPDGGDEVFFSGPSLDSLTPVAHLRSANGPALIARSGGETYLLRHTRPDNTPGEAFAVHLLKLDPNRPAVVVTASQAITVPPIAPGLSATWALDWTGAATTPAVLTAELTDALGVQHMLASLTADEGAAQPWADLSPWAGQQITLTFRFDPRGDPTAWAWVDDVHLGGMPLNTGVSLVRNSFPKAGQPATFTLIVTNRDPYRLNVPVALNWPIEWALDSCTASGAISPGVAHFEVPVDGVAAESITCTVNIPPETRRITKTISATIGQPIAGQDYTAADNRTTLTLIVDGRPTWLPVIAR